MITKLVALAAVLASALALTACGGEPESANVNGTWSLAASGPAPKATWKVTPSCEKGACDFKAYMGLGQTVDFKWNEASGDYTSVSSATSDCLKSNGKVGAKDAIKASSTTTFTPTAAKSDDVTAADVRAKMTITISSAGVKAGCPAQGGQGSITTQKATRD